jgi:hypothetical protein
MHTIDWIVFFASAALIVVTAGAMRTLQPADTRRRVFIGGSFIVVGLGQFVLAARETILHTATTSDLIARFLIAVGALVAGAGAFVERFPSIGIVGVLVIGMGGMLFVRSVLTHW